MKTSEIILFFFFCLFVILGIFEALSKGIGVESIIFFGCAFITMSYFVLPSKGMALTAMGIIVMSLEPFLLFGIVLVIAGGLILALEMWEMQEEIKKRFFQKYNIKPEKIDIPLFEKPKLSFKEKKEIFGTYLMSNIFRVKIKTEQGWQELYYDNANKRLIEK